MRKLPLQCFCADFASFRLPSLHDTKLVEIMPPKASKKQTTGEAAKSDAYVWSYDEVELLLQVTNEVSSFKFQVSFIINQS